MSLKYAPDQGAEPDSHWSTVYLSLHDVSARVPINFVTVPGVHLTKACFSDGVYDDIPTQTCLSDLVASQFRRVIIDLYWDNINRQFNLCPVELPPLAGNSTSGYSVDVSALSSITATSAAKSMTIIPVTSVAANSPSADAASLGKRQSSANDSTSTVASPTTSRMSTNAAPVPTSTGASGTTLLELGPYKCSLDLNLGSIISFYDDYFGSTSDTISARLHYLILNLHAAAPFTAPSEPAHTPMQARLPHSDDLVGAQFESNFPRALFTPGQLQEDRENLNKSWFRDNFGMRTDTNYFQISEAGDDTVSTQDGWPGEEWILLTHNRRLLLTWGEIDPQMEAYDFHSDSGNVFAAGYVDSSRPVETNNAGVVMSGCFFQPGDATIEQVNSSWAMSTINHASLDSLSTFAQNLTSCGISPNLNMTIENSPAQKNLDQYRDFVQSAVFGWAPGEPSNASEPNQHPDGASGDYRCALMDSTSGYAGRWRVDRCQKKHRAACRVANEPYAWRLSTVDVPFAAAPDACPEHTEFDLPRTGLENTYLYRQVLNDSGSRDASDSILSGVWIDFNSLDRQDCWVTGGPNATCPYTDNEEEIQQRQVLIPTIAALIVLILTVLTLLVKCNQNRRNSRARRRGDNGWEYEGVPS
ncbi:uncharacterized protein Z518_03719 [Rhinocladiella mackenziei CBS 650.93]|uniref:Maintenance of telomere capping protein 6 n=1 Tax=Rhinocladiella mackenziei CBS 650.93 TaxID=1442369 RepID=A0A0D2FUG6_9EURO|nr:uncharacterized protein Z518_03719 [Rhinocladiella mackenziei CBS 650.93]KIX05747.1 hypothetical protein Z518_03719 [Rhinocladiella mackenziei CBS 650.93]